MNAPTWRKQDWSDIVETHTYEETPAFDEMSKLTQEYVKWLKHVQMKSSLPELGVFDSGASALVTTKRVLIKELERDIKLQ